MKSIFVQEKKKYCKEDFCVFFECDEKEAQLYINKLINHNIVSVTNRNDYDNSDLLDYEYNSYNTISSNKFYQFLFVGIVIIDDIVFKCYPKYISKETKPINELKQIVKVLEKYNSNKQTVFSTHDAGEEVNHSSLSLYLYFIKDYYEYGIYNFEEIRNEQNGEGAINWEKTINECSTVIYNNKPYYLDWYSEVSVNNNNYIIKRLHEYILTTISKQLENAELTEIFSFQHICLSVEEIDCFGDVNNIEYLINKELSIQFNTRKQSLLKAMLLFFKHKNLDLSNIAIDVYGTTTFDRVWQEVCGETLDNKLYEDPHKLKLPTVLKYNYKQYERLIDIIEKPYWSITGRRAIKTLEPDLISIRGTDFMIFDAKYYTPILIEGQTPMHQPGVNDVVKQYLYQMSFNSFIRDHGFVNVNNCFLIPTEKESFIDKGIVSLEMLEVWNVSNIKIWMVPATLIYDYYLKNRRDFIEILLTSFNLE